MARVGRAVLDVLLPPHCPGCNEMVDAPGQICVACFGQIGFISRPFCTCCGVPFAHAGQAGSDGLCPACLAQPPGFRRARAALRYDHACQKLILPLKHADRTELAGTLAQHMARAGAELLAGADCLVPVPLHRDRLRERRYNQSALLAQALGRRVPRPVLLDTLQRHRATPSLGELGAAARIATLQGAFSLRPGRAAAIIGRHVLLIDDVLTSGATASECARILLAAGAATVDVLVAARVPDPRLTD
jgi:ComF family protein